SNLATPTLRGHGPATTAISTLSLHDALPISDFLAVSVRINADSTGPATLNVNGLGARPLKKANGNDAVGLKANGIYTFRYNASRSEEHTSELQSRENLVCRLLHEKKKRKKQH